MGQATEPEVTLIPRSEYVRFLKQHLPPEAFEPRPAKLWQVAAHFVVIGAAYYAIGRFDNVFVRLLCSFIIGHSLTCMVFIVHEITHGAVLRRSNPLRYPLEVVMWGLNLIPATMWRKLHNEIHHVHAQTMQDTDRFYRPDEFEAKGGGLRRWYTMFFFPHRFARYWKLLVGFHFVTYILRHLAAVFYPGDRRPAVVSAKPAYRPSDRARIIGELAAIAAMQVGVFYAAGGTWLGWMWASPIALLICSSLAMAYIWTNHYIHDLHELHDPLITSTSIEVHPVLDKLHNNFSYHTEHHLFPGMNSDYYPLVSKLLIEHYGNRYHRTTFSDAWYHLWKREPYALEIKSSDEHATAAQEVSAGGVS